MSRPVFKAIVAMAANRVIGKEGDLPWRIPEDLKWFKKLTLGHPILMGRKTMDSIGRPLPKRRNLVLSRSLTEVPDGFELISDVESLSRDMDWQSESVFVIGGAQIYNLLFPLCEEVLLSYVYDSYEGDTYLPEFEADFEMKEILFKNEEFELRRYIRS